jgi:hypothetical protein
MTLLLTLVACFDPDPDRDQLLNVDESELGTDRQNPDSDGDGLFDGHEVYFYLTDPLAEDSDGDGDADGWEVDRGLDPTDEESHGYTGGWPMLTLAEKAELEARPHPVVVEVGKRIKRTRGFDQNLESFDLYDLALQNRYTILHSDSASWRISQWIDLTFDMPLDGMPTSLRPLILDGSVGAITVASDGSSEPEVDVPIPWDAAADALNLPFGDVFPNLADDSMELWAFLDRPEPGEKVYLLDDRMIVRAINDFDLMLDLIEAGPPPAPEED